MQQLHTGVVVKIDAVLDAAVTDVLLVLLIDPFLD